LIESVAVSALRAGRLDPPASHRDCRLFNIDVGEGSTVVLAVAFAAGFSDRLVMGIVKSVEA
jgi:hypothetical protein